MSSSAPRASLPPPPLPTRLARHVPATKHACHPPAARSQHPTHTHTHALTYNTHWRRSDRSERMSQFSSAQHECSAELCHNITTPPGELPPHATRKTHAAVAYRKRAHVSRRADVQSTSCTGNVNHRPRARRATKKNVRESTRGHVCAQKEGSMVCVFSGPQLKKNVHDSSQHTATPPPRARRGGAHLARPRAPATSPSPLLTGLPVPHT